jgi:hypothetical protein
LPSQRFSRSQGFSPASVCRPCFMPVPPLGFCPSRTISVRRALRASQPFPALLWLAHRLVPLAIFLSEASPEILLTSFKKTSRLESLCRLAPLKGFSPCGRPFPCFCCYTSAGLAALKAFSSSGVSQKFCPGPLRCLSSLGLFQKSLPKKIFLLAPQSLEGKIFGGRLSRAHPPLSRSLTS